MLANPTMNSAPASDNQAALARYSQTLHRYTQQLWQDARRQAELRAQTEARSLNGKKQTRGDRSSPTAPSRR
ncbi:hypothetical protein M422DRAFT_29613 [Sphaerobolus stellatus SS14]|uniref:Uncharacterized protein n=1 Tax=Sphaerobolus stellatus (strain SS14) TaxID=990650 RepID=A0A0C9VSK8_SPHS4|nr:hypothetical protein M422DRAFT_29613 [Sphaerobolus stellatus SS14]